MVEQCQVTYSAWKVSRLVGVHQNTILRWEKSGKIPKAKRHGNNNSRYWLPKDVELIINFFLGK